MIFFSKRSIGFIPKINNLFLEAKKMIISDDTQSRKDFFLLYIGNKIDNAKSGYVKAANGILFFTVDMKLSN